MGEKTSIQSMERKGSIMNHIPTFYSHTNSSTKDSFFSSSFSYMCFYKIEGVKEMSCSKEACAECNRSCLLIHKNGQNQAPRVTSFFKVMFGSHFSQVLTVPPLFASKNPGLLDTEIILEDVTAKTWKAKISKLDSSIAIQQGWKEFSLDHNIQIGNFLVFHYIRRSHFVVKVYNESACEMTNFPERRVQQEASTPTASPRVYTNPVNHEENRKRNVKEASMKGKSFAESHCGVKTEKGDKTPTSTAYDYCVVSVDTRSQLLLPDGLPSFRRPPNAKSAGSVIYLQDSYKRLWPVLYNSTFGILGSGWKSFCIANNIRKGHTCMVKVEDRSDYIYSLVSG